MDEPPRFLKKPINKYKSLDDRIKGHINTAAAIGLAIIDTPGQSEWLFCGVPAINATYLYLKSGFFKDVYQSMKKGCDRSKKKY